MIWVEHVSLRFGVNQDGGHRADIYVIHLVSRILLTLFFWEMAVDKVDKLGISVNEKTWRKLADDKIDVLKTS